MSLGIAFRADAANDIGTGHVMRCLTLADALKARGAETLFISRDLPGHMHDVVLSRGHRAVLLPAPTDQAQSPTSPPPHAAWLKVPVAQDMAESAQALSAHAAHWLVLDHYALDATWQQGLQQAIHRPVHVLVIDDLADRPHVCDLLLDSSQPDAGDTYQRLLPTTCRLLLGPQFALLRPQFATARATVQPRSGSVGRILVFYGGSDPDLLTAQTLTAIAQVAGHLAVDVVIGRNTSAAQRSAIEQSCADLANVTCHLDVRDMATLMARADLAFGAAGVTTWERACLGVPTLAVTVAQNQRGVAKAAVQRGILSWLGDAQEITVDRLAQALHTALQQPKMLAEQSRRALDWVDGRGVDRVCEAMLGSP